MKNLLAVCTLAGCLLSGGCDFFNKDSDGSKSPTAPSAGVSLESFAGTWSSAAASAPPTGCGGLKYTVTPVNASTANVTFAGTCAGGIQVNGTGTGTVRGESLDWSAQGLVSQGGVNCPFTFTNGKAVADGAGAIKVTYSGTVCGIPVSGTEIVKK